MKALKDALPESLKAELDRLDFKPFEPMPPACQTCNDLGVVSVEAPPDSERKNLLVPCPNPHCPKGNEQRARIWNARYKNARIPDHYRGLTFQTWEALPPDYQAGKWTAYAAADLFASRPNHYFSRADIFERLEYSDPQAGEPDRPKNSVMLFGAVGMGKTGLMAASANKLIADGRSPLYLRQTDLIEAIQSRYGKEDYPSAEDVLRDFKTAPLLFLDELGDESKRPDRLEKVESIIEHRRAEYLPTFMTTNLTQSEFRRAWGERTGDRVINMAHWVECTGLKLRQTESPIGVL